MSGPSKRKADDAQLSVSADILECAVCTCAFDHQLHAPRSLVCGHHFCSACLVRLVHKPDASSRHSITCPNCASPTPVPGGDVLRLAKNWFAAGLLDAFSEAQRSLGISSELAATAAVAATVGVAESSSSSSSSSLSALPTPAFASSFSAFSSSSAVPSAFSPLNASSSAASFSASLASVFSPLTTTVADVVCELCDEVHTATHRCQECEQHMCDAMNSLHRRMMGTMHHRVVKLGGGDAGGAVLAGAHQSLHCAPADVVPLCKQHGEKKVFFDLQCRQLLCAHCVCTPAHAPHAIHIKSLSQAAAECRLELAEWEERLTKLLLQVDSASMQHARREEAIAQEALKAAAHLTSAFDQAKIAVTNTLDMRRDALLRKLEEVRGNKLARLRDELDSHKWFGVRDKAKAALERVRQCGSGGGGDSNLASLAAYADVIPSLDAMLTHAPNIVTVCAKLPSSPSSSSAAAASTSTVDSSSVAGSDAASSVLPHFDYDAQLSIGTLLNSVSSLGSVGRDQNPSATAAAADSATAAAADADASPSLASPKAPSQRAARTLAAASTLTMTSNESSSSASSAASSSELQAVFRELGVQHNVVFVQTGFDVVYYVGRSVDRNRKARVKVFNNHRNQLKATYGSEQLKCLNRVAVSTDNLVVCSDREAHCLFVYSLMDGAFVRQIGEPGSEPGQFQQPWGVAISSRGVVYSADLDNHRIQVFQLSDGTFLRSFGTHGSGPGQLSGPCGVSLTPDESELVVADCWNDRVCIFSAAGEFKRFIGRGKGKGDGQLMCPADVLVVQHGGQARVVVADTGNHRVQSYTLEGKHVRSFGSKRSSDAGPNTFLSPDCLGWDALHAHLYVSCLDTPGMQTQIPPALFM